MKDSLILKLFLVSKSCFFEIFQCFFRSARRLIATVINHYYDKKLGVKTCEFDFYDKEKSFYKSGKYADGAPYEPTPYCALKKVVDYLKLNADDVFIDMGCGKGRAVFFFGAYRLKKIIGIELKKELADIASKNLENFRVQNSPIEIINEDIVNFDLREGTIFFLFNPFGFKTLEKVLANIRSSLEANPRRIQIVYRNPIYADLLNSQDWLKKEEEGNVAGIHVWRNMIFPRKSGHNEELVLA